MPELIDRPAPLAWLRRWRDRDVIKVVTGVRRCGKSTLLRLHRDQLLAGGVPASHIVELNLEDPQFADLLGDYRALYQAVKSRLPQAGKAYVFIDEIQRADQFERVVDGLFITPNTDLYLTGSSSHLLSGNLATLLTGRYVEYRLLPLSFSEYVRYRGRKFPSERPPLRDWYDDYTRWGGFPFAVSLSSDDETRQYLEGILSTVLLKDVARAQRVANISALQTVTQFVFSTIGSQLSPKRIADTLTSRGSKISRQTVDSYLTGLTDAFVTYPVGRWDVRGKRLLERGEKYYVVDSGLRRALLGSRPVDTGHVLENTVYLELLRRPGRVFAGSLDGHEIDFVVERDDGITYVQVAANVEAPATLERELAPLRSAPGYHQRLLLTLDREPPQSFEGIQRRSVLEWLANPSGPDWPVGSHFF